MPTRIEISNWFRQLQLNICQGLEALDTKARFKEDTWERPGGGGGHTRVIQNGKVLAKGGVNFSAVEGDMPESLLKILGVNAQDKALEFYATGVSIVLHPNSPMVPIIHMNVRYFEVSNGIWWFGGGIDLTPHYVNRDLAQKFHQKLKNACDKHDSSYYPRFKEWADDYFYIKHRQETRGIGGIFFDRLGMQEPHTKEELWAFVQEVGNTFVEAYSEQVMATQNLPFGEKELQWQQLRRGRYVEFNLVWDKGTQFGLHTDGRTESILMSLPPVANWVYDYQAKTSSEEEKTLTMLKKGIDWVGQKVLNEQ